MRIGKLKMKNDEEPHVKNISSLIRLSRVDVLMQDLTTRFTRPELTPLIALVDEVVRIGQGALSAVGKPNISRSQKENKQEAGA